MNNSMPLEERVRISYKKLKASVYFDKTLLPLRDDIVAFESNDIEDKLNKLAEYLESDDDQAWKLYSDTIISAIDARLYPKKLNDHSSNKIIFNADDDEIQLEKAQYFVNLPVEGHVLGVLWVISVGFALDNRSEDSQSTMYEHSYGNRLRKTLINPKKNDITYSPNLFESYFTQYESWRDIALQQAKARLDKKQDALILTMDLKSFYYSVHIQKEDYESIIKIVHDAKQNLWIRRVHEFVYKVLEQYSNIVSKMSTDSELQISSRIILPIGFLPSCILSNWVLTPFDDAIIRRINPVYYGRYVDDIIIVDKVEKNSPLRKKAQRSGDEKLTTKDVIDYYFRACASNREVPDHDQCNQELFIIVPETEMTEKQKKVYDDAQKRTERSEKEFAQVYRINPVVLSSEYKKTKPDIQIQNGKVKIFYFHEGETRALLDCFRTKIGQNSSEFRLLPDMDRVLDKNDYSEIFQLTSTESPHKLRGVSGVSIDKFSLSKFLGKFRKVGNMIRDKKENSFERDLCEIMNKRILIENYALWERLLEIMIVNERYDIYVKLVKNIMDAINKLNIPENIVLQDVHIDYRQSLIVFLRSAISRTTALCWGKKMTNTLNEISETVQKMKISGNLDLSFFEAKALNDDRKQYCMSRMINKYVMPLPIDCIDELIYSEEEKNIRLCKLEDSQTWINADWINDERYPYFPYMVTPQELSFALACTDIAEQQNLDNPKNQHCLICNLYEELNYRNPIHKKSGQVDRASIMDKVIVESIENNNQTGRNLHYIAVESETVQKLHIAVGNARLYKDDFKHALTGKPNRTYARYQQLTKILRSAIEAKVELLVLPENYLPWEWVPDIARICATNQMALVTGIEHIVSRHDEEKPGCVYNLTAVMLPYQQDEYKYSHVVYHQKVHYSPEEQRMIAGYRFVPKIGNDYQLFQWKDVWFSVYCCYELASIHDRALFQSVVDLTIAVEWNMDTNYFSSIIESMCRDLHCFLIQANSSDYGDSRVMSPSKTEARDIIKTKGGTNSTILIDYIDIQALRDYQYMAYELQRQDEQFKPTPPQFAHVIIEQKRKKTLGIYLKENGLPK